jgi:hypothetical protein
MTDYELTCLVEGGQTAFTVLVARTCKVYEMREKIYQNRKNTAFRLVGDSGSLIISKVRDYYVLNCLLNCPLTCLSYRLR